MVSSKMQPILFLFFCAFLSHSKGNIYRSTGTDKLESSEGADNVGEPLILTPFLTNGSILEAQRAALVQNPQFQSVVSYAGYFTVDEKFDSNMFFWFFPSTGDVTKDPIVLWLNGGPGVTSLMGLFAETGPFFVNNDSSVSLREYSWHKNHSLIFIDNPVGTGFSFTNGGHAQNMTKIGDDMFSCLTQFFQLFPDLQQNPFFLSGESYAGKYLPAIGYAILKKNPQTELKINLKGILMGTGWTDPINQINYGPYAYNIGLISAADKEEMDRVREDAIAKVKEEDWYGATKLAIQLTTIITEASNVSIRNYISGDYKQDKGEWINFASSNEIRRALHVGNVSFGFNDKAVKVALATDDMKSVAPWVEELLETYKILVFAGQTDIICGYPMIRDYLEKLNFSGRNAFHNSSRGIWYVENEPAGYVRRGGNLVELMVRNAGHRVPTDQPKWSYDMLYKFVRNIPYV